MPRVTLTFELPMEQEEFSESYHGGEYLRRLRLIDDWLRHQLEDGIRTKTQREAYEHIRNMIGEVHE